MKTTTILPFFKWRTNGTKKAVPSTKSAGQYDVAGTLSPLPVKETTTFLPPSAGRFPSLNITNFGENRIDVGNITQAGDNAAAGAATKAGVGAATKPAAEPAEKAAAEATKAQSKK